MYENIIFLLIGLVGGYLVGRLSGVSVQQYTALCEKQAEDMKGFATAYSELSIQMFNFNNKTDNSFTRHLPNAIPSKDAVESVYDDDDMLAGILKP